MRQHKSVIGFPESLSSCTKQLLGGEIQIWSAMLGHKEFSAPMPFPMAFSFPMPFSQNNYLPNPVLQFALTTVWEVFLYLPIALTHNCQVYGEFSFFFLWPLGSWGAKEMLTQFAVDWIWKLALRINGNPIGQIRFNNQLYDIFRMSATGIWLPCHSNSEISASLPRE